jgi:hypothetical protein
MTAPSRPPCFDKFIAQDCRINTYIAQQFYRQLSTCFLLISQAWLCFLLQTQLKDASERIFILGASISA